MNYYFKTTNLSEIYQKMHYFYWKYARPALGDPFPRPPDHFAFGGWELSSRHSASGS